jgi:hypothetical protein
VRRRGGGQAGRQARLRCLSSCHRHPSRSIDSLRVLDDSARGARQTCWLAAAPYLYIVQTWRGAAGDPSGRWLLFRFLFDEMPDLSRNPRPRDGPVHEQGRSTSKAAAGSTFLLLLLVSLLLSIDADDKVEGHEVVVERSRTKTRPDVSPDASSCAAMRSSWTVVATLLLISAYPQTAAEAAFPAGGVVGGKGGGGGGRGEEVCSSDVVGVSFVDVVVSVAVVVSAAAPAAAAAAGGGGGCED